MPSTQKKANTLTTFTTYTIDIIRPKPQLNVPKNLKLSQNPEKNSNNKNSSQPTNKTSLSTADPARDIDRRPQRTEVQQIS